jgi:hypothetical protein
MRYSYTRRSLHRHSKASPLSEENAHSPLRHDLKTAQLFQKVQARHPFFSFPLSLISSQGSALAGLSQAAGTFGTFGLFAIGLAALVI